MGPVMKQQACHTHVMHTFRCVSALGPAPTAVTATSQLRLQFGLTRCAWRTRQTAPPRAYSRDTTAAAGSGAASSSCSASTSLLRRGVKNLATSSPGTCACARRHDSAAASTQNGSAAHHPAPCLCGPRPPLPRPRPLCSPRRTCAWLLCFHVGASSLSMSRARTPS